MNDSNPVNDRASRFERLVLKCIGDIGHGVTFAQLQEKLQELGKRQGLFSTLRLLFALFRLDRLGFVHSWSDDPPIEGKWDPTIHHYRLQLRGQRLLDAIAEREKEKRLGAAFAAMRLLFGSRG